MDQPFAEFEPFFNHKALLNKSHFQWNASFLKDPCWKHQFKVMLWCCLSSVKCRQDAKVKSPLMILHWNLGIVTVSVINENFCWCSSLISHLLLIFPIHKINVSYVSLAASVSLWDVPLVVIGIRALVCSGGGSATFICKKQIHRR